MELYSVDCTESQENKKSSIKILPPVGWRPIIRCVCVLRLAFFHSVSCVLHLRYVRRNARRQENVRCNGEC